MLVITRGYHQCVNWSMPQLNLSLVSQIGFEHDFRIAEVIAVSPSMTRPSGSEVISGDRKHRGRQSGGTLPRAARNSARARHAAL